MEYSKGNKMKTNHQRGFVEPITAYVGSHRNGTRLRTDPEFPNSITYPDGRVEYYRGGMGSKSFTESVTVGDEVIQVSSIANIHDTNNGKHGVAKNIRGAKKYVRSRIRAKANEVTKKLLQDTESEME
jgi:hypothetical protein